MSEIQEPTSGAQQPASPPAGAQEPAPGPGPSVQAPPVDDGWSDDESVLSWKLFAGVFVVLAVLGVAAFALFGGGEEETAKGGTSANAAVADDFDRADNATSLGDTTTGQAWTAVAGTWGIQGEAAYVAVPNQGAGGRNVAVVDLGSSNGAVEATASGISAGWGLVFRYQGPNNYWMVAAAPEFGTYNLQKVVDGQVVAAVKGGLGNAAVTDGTKVRVEFSGPTVTVKINGNLLKSIQDPALQSATNVGLVVPKGGADAARWDDFAAERGAASVPAAPGGGAGAGGAGG